MVWKEDLDYICVWLDYWSPSLENEKYNEMSVIYKLDQVEGGQDDSKHRSNMCVILQGLLPSQKIKFRCL